MMVTRRELTSAWANCVCFFFFSSRRRHTRFDCDWSSDVCSSDLFSYGTKTLDRIAFQKALDEIAAELSAGYDFSLEVRKEDFSRGIELLADNEMNPALPAEAFDITQRQLAQFIAGRSKRSEEHTSELQSQSN